MVNYLVVNAPWGHLEHQQTFDPEQELFRSVPVCHVVSRCVALCCVLSLSGWLAILLITSLTNNAISPFYFPLPTSKSTYHR